MGNKRRKDGERTVRKEQKEGLGKKREKKKIICKRKVGEEGRTERRRENKGK